MPIRRVVQRYKSVEYGTITQVILPGNVNTACTREARLAKMPKQSYLAQIIIHRHTMAKLEKKISERVQRFADRTGITKDAAINRLLNVALGYVE